MYIKRAIEGKALETSKTLPILLVTGPRQVGKSTMLEKLADSDRKIVSLDDPDIRFLAKNDPGLFIQRYSSPVLIDEIQYAPELLPYLKMEVDKSKRNGDYWITGTQSFSMMKAVSESLAGRVGIINLLGLSTNEINQTPNNVFATDPKKLMARAEEVVTLKLNELFERIFRGSMPKLYADATVDIDTYYRSYIDTYLKRDIRDLAQVVDEMAFYNFLTIVAARTAKPVIYQELAAECGISAPTAKRWLSILVSSNMIALVQPYHNNLLKRVTKMPLIHFLDTGLCAHLLKWGNPEALERGHMAGAFFESYVFSEIYKGYLYAGKEPLIYYYRDKDKREVDLLLYENATLYPLEIKKAASPGKDAIKHFSVLDPLVKTAVGTGAVICLSKNLLPIDEKNWLVPVELI